MNMIILSILIGLMLFLAYRTLIFAKHDDRVLAWLTFSWFLFVGRYTGAFWYTNGENDLQNSENLWYFDLLRAQWLILATVINVLLSQIAAGIRDYVIKHKDRINDTSLRRSQRES